MPSTAALGELTTRLRSEKVENAAGAKDDWAMILGSNPASDEMLDAVAGALGVAGGALRQLKVGCQVFEGKRLSALFPEFDASGRAVGVLVRYADGKKLA